MGQKRGKKRFHRLVSSDIIRAVHVKKLLGLRVLITYSFVIALFYLFLALIFPTTMLFGIVLSGLLGRVFNALMFFAVMVMVYGFEKRAAWSRKFAVWLYLFSILNSVISMLFVGRTELGVLSGLLFPLFIFTILLNALTAWYVLVRKECFSNRHLSHLGASVDPIDRVFISSVYLFYFFLIIFTVALGFEFYRNATYIVDVVIADLNGKTFKESIPVCEHKSGDMRDICFVSLAAIHKGSASVDVCDFIRSDFYRFTCLQV